MFLHSKRNVTHDKLTSLLLLASCLCHLSFGNLCKWSQDEKQAHPGAVAFRPSSSTPHSLQRAGRQGLTGTFLELLQQLTCHEAGNSLCWAGEGRCSTTQKSWHLYHGFLLTPVLHLLMLALLRIANPCILQHKQCAILKPSISSIGNLTPPTKSLDNLPSIS